MKIKETFIKVMLLNEVVKRLLLKSKFKIETYNSSI